MTVHRIDITPSWDAVVRITLGVLENNDFYSEPSNDAKNIYSIWLTYWILSIERSYSHKKWEIK